MEANNDTIARAIRNLYHTMPRNNAEATIAGYEIQISTAKDENAPILIRVKSGENTALWFHASKRASAANSLYTMSEKIAARIAK